VADGGGEGDLLRGCSPGGVETRGAEALHQSLRQQGDRRGTVRLAGLDHLHERGPAERVDAEETRPEGRAPLSLEARHIHRREGEGARHRPFARLRRALEHEGVRRVEPDGAQELHERGPPVVGSSQDGVASASASEWRSGSALPRQRTSRSPSRASEGTAPFSSRRRSTYRRVTAASSPARQESRARIRWRAKLSTSRPEPASSKPSCSRAVAKGRSPTSSWLSATSRMDAPNTSQSGTLVSAAPAGQANRPPPTRPPSTKIASG